MTEQEWRKEFAHRLQVLSYRKKRYNRKQLAEASGLSEKTIGRYRRGERTPDAISISKIARALDCSVDELIPNEDVIEDAVEE